jgi:hypothetical protein
MKGSWIIAVSSECLVIVVGAYWTVQHAHDSTIAIALWAMTPNTRITPDLQLSIDNVYDGGVGGVVTDNPQWSSTGRGD